MRFSTVALAVVCFATLLAGCSSDDLGPDTISVGDTELLVSADIIVPDDEIPPIIDLAAPSSGGERAVVTFTNQGSVTQQFSYAVASYQVMKETDYGPCVLLVVARGGDEPIDQETISARVMDLHPETFLMNRKILKMDVAEVEPQGKIEVEVPAYRPGAMELIDTFKAISLD